MQRSLVGSEMCIRDSSNPVNSVLLGRSEREDDLHWTDCVATPDGWCFRIPNIDSVSHGYLFNKDITTVEQARENFKDLFGIDSNDNLNFSNYISNQFIIDDRVCLNGNKLMFLEPLEANSNPAYVQATNRYLSYMLGRMSKRKVCLLYTSPSPRDYAASRMPSSA